MPLAPGTRLGPYEVVGAVGAGGMGEVYRARDTRLNRDVALKVLPEAFAADADRLARFEREAHVLATLNHPNIAQIHGFEDAGATHAIAMEFVEGQTLADRISRGPVPVDELVPIARQMADALEAAHEQGIIHRDLKPANVAVRADGVVKVLDFGLARALAPDGSGATASDSANSPTLTARATQLGVILGTAAYMAPEQARGRPIDRRADIWAFGVVVHEMLTGERCFKGEDISETLASVLKDRPSFDTLPAGTSPRLRRLLERCLERDPKQRLRDIGEARIELAAIEAGAPDGSAASGSTSAPVVAPPARGAAPWIVAAALAVGLVGTVVMWAPWTPALSGQIVRFSFVPAPDLAINPGATDRDLAISPQGTHIAYVAGGDGRLVVRAIDGLEVRPLSGITDARYPFFSWDGRWIGFFASGGMKKVSITGGPALTVCPTDGPPRGASWGPDDVIVFATANTSSGLFSVRAGGGEPTALTTPDAGSDAYFPSVLPGGHAVLFTIASSEVENSQVAVLDLETGEQKILIRGGSHAEYLEAPGGGREVSGYLVYGASGTLRAVPFDLPSLEVRGDAVPVIDRVAMAGNTGAVNYATAPAGTLVYVPGDVTAGIERVLVWVDREGREEAIATVPTRGYYALRLSPDGAKVAVESRDEDNDIWIWDVPGEKLSRLTIDSAQDSFPIWMPDSRRIVFRSARGGPGGDLFWQAADGTGVAEPLMQADGQQTATSVTPDGKTLLVTNIAGADNAFIDQFEFDTRESDPLLKPAYPVRNGEVSPDGRFVAYESHEATPQIFVRPFPDVDGGRWQVSTAGGLKPVWAPNGRELFYVGLDRNRGMADLYAVPVAATPAFTSGRPVKIAEIWVPAGQGNGRPYDVSRDGTRFMAIRPATLSNAASQAASVEMVFVVHWIEEVKARVGAR